MVWLKLIVCVLVILFAGQKVARYGDVIAQRKEGFSVLSGDDNVTLDLIEAGGDGVISVASNLVPDKMVAMVHTALDGDMPGARAVEQELAELFRVEFIETNPIPIKTAMALVGLCTEAFRLPLCELEKPEHRVEIQKAVRQLGLRSIET